MYGLARKDYDYVWPSPARTRLHRTHSWMIQICPRLHATPLCYFDSLRYSLTSKPFVDFPL